MREVIINADDYGLSVAHVDGILTAFKAGMISSTSFLADSPAFEYGVKRLAEFPGLGVGAHLVTRDHVDASTLEKEFREQIKKLLYAGIALTHLDNHLPDIYYQPDLFSIVIKLAKEFDLPIRMPFDLDFKRGSDRLANVVKKPAKIVRSIGEKLRANAWKEQIRFPDYFWLDFTNGARSAAGLVQILSNLPDGISEICCHPGNEGERQQTELSALLSDDVGDYFASHKDIKLVDFRTVKANK